MPFSITAALSTDSLIMSIALAPLLQGSRARVLFALLFGLFDGLAFVVGSLIALPVMADDWLDRAGPLMLAVYAIYVAFVLDRRWWRGATLGSLYCVPALMSIDNLAYGGTSSTASIARGAVALGVGSTLFALAGTLVGSALVRRTAWSRGRLPGLGLGVAALLLLVA